MEQAPAVHTESKAPYAGVCSQRETADRRLS
jgi:hypothetical protein